MNASIKSISSFSLAILGVLIWGALIGIFVSLLSNFIYIVFLFPLGMGFLGAMFVEKAIHDAKIRKAAQGIFLGTLMTVAIYGAYHFSDYLVFRGGLVFEMNNQIVAETGRSELEAANFKADYTLKEETGHTGFLGYILHMDKRGVEIGRTVGSSSFNLGPFFTWTFWLLELAIIGWLTVAVGRKAAGRPFCEECNRWYGEEQRLGGVNQAHAAILTLLFEQGKFDLAGRILEMGTENPSLEVYAQRCETCTSGDTRLTLKRTSRAKMGKLKFKPSTKLSVRSAQAASMLRELRSNI